MHKTGTFEQKPERRGAGQKGSKCFGSGSSRAKVLREGQALEWEGLCIVSRERVRKE